MTSYKMPKKEIGKAQKSNDYFENMCFQNL